MVADLIHQLVLLFAHCCFDFNQGCLTEGGFRSGLELQEQTNSGAFNPLFDHLCSQLPLGPHRQNFVSFKLTG